VIAEFAVRGGWLVDQDRFEPWAEAFEVVDPGDRAVGPGEDLSGSVHGQRSQIPAAIMSPGWPRRQQSRLAGGPVS
jgi:hypothetical protein